ncbi:WD40/YVTN/BNR-like repeat-containing protein [Haloarcula brevis]|uniref:WD40/YVTN/BNR-like repeat-containing protein n=1 Tax=Haloarcula brevis TaxID=3111453 RepID=UPI00300E8E45
MHIAYAALSDRVFATDGNTAEDCLVGHDIECVAADPAAPDRAFVGTVDAGLQRTTDRGATWESVLDAGDRVTSVTVSPQDPDVVWAGTEPSAVYRSTDGGETWTERPGLTDLDSSSRWSFPPRPHTHHVRWIALAPDDPERVYVAIEAGAFVRSPDGGETWVDHPEGARRDNHTLATHPDAPERVYTAAGDGYALSTDRGETWSHPQDGLGHRYVWGLAVRPDDPDGVVVSAASGPRSAHSTSGESYVYRWTGDRWAVAMAGLPGPEGLARPVLAADPDGGLVALTNHGLFRSAAGAEWAAAWPETGVADWPSEYDQVPSGLAVV